LEDTGNRQGVGLGRGRPYAGEPVHVHGGGQAGPFPGIRVSKLMSPFRRLRPAPPKRRNGLFRHAFTAERIQPGARDGSLFKASRPLALSP
jgi:hypothetical protein